ncbi:MAG: nickel pincer cofactor biosynthesis protein LarB [Candidatus Omnitrophica bacterium]|nr:nickel pincer cofactor biosynthesis protein LarB [Candidatus Omnitrophota bacterium]MBU4346575.1 nickel pincer cofactor biosynthesis protein LarB [Candidatus Omnitrophota bacterium]MBU4472586.1 nickel pincer cofactor biosynthesis protein LarB [Candidatus Omnitrophota bacterium]MCG2705946.1 nickel pincer cofactor biosynthesis protein LarB [Candidatus Omnitrophota bacterium]
MSVEPSFCDLGFAKVDIGRKRRRGFSEVIYCPGKTKEQLKKIAQKLISNNQDLLLTKLEKATFSYLKKSFRGLKYNSLARLGYALGKDRACRKGLAAVVSAGTSDIPVAEEAAVTLEVMGNRVVRLYDVGVAGVHRLINNIDILKKAKVIIIIAGMEGALASLVSGLVSCPVIAVPTSCGYGASFRGLSALLTMLNCCSPGVAVVNIDNGFGAGYFASLINK